MTADGGTGAFRFVLFALDAGSDYYVEASGVRSPAFHLDVADIPYVKRVDLEYHSPPTPASRRRPSPTRATWPRCRAPRCAAVTPP